MTLVRRGTDNLCRVANERFNSWLIDEGERRPIEAKSLSRMLFTALLLSAVGVLVVWALFLLLASS